MQRKKTGMLFQFCCLAAVMISKRQKLFNKFSNIGSDIGLLFQITDDLIDYRGIAKCREKEQEKIKKKEKQL